MYHHKTKTNTIHITRLQKALLAIQNKAESESDENSGELREIKSLQQARLLVTHDIMTMGELTLFLISKLHKAVNFMEEASKVLKQSVTPNYLQLFQNKITFISEYNEQIKSAAKSDFSNWQKHSFSKFCCIRDTLKDSADLYRTFSDKKESSLFITYMKALDEFFSHAIDFAKSKRPKTVSMQDCFSFTGPSGNKLIC